MRTIRLSWYHLLDSVKEFWYEHSEQVSFTIWMIVVFIISVMAWAYLNAAEACFR